LWGDVFSVWPLVFGIWSVRPWEKATHVNNNA
jgi:hypothetical protein